jgi:hypothetical protein
MVENFADAGFTGTVGAAEKIFLRLDAVTDDLAAAICADGRQFVNRAFKAIENVTVASRHDLER